MGVKYGYMCAVDYHHELGEALGGNVVFPNVSDLKRKYKCTDECGIVRVRISLDKVILKENYDNLKNKPTVAETRKEKRLNLFVFNRLNACLSGWVWLFDICNNKFRLFHCRTRLMVRQEILNSHSFCQKINNNLIV